MTRISDKSDGAVLYHAVSSYQLLEVLLHRLLVHPHAPAVLLLPDFITRKYPRYQKLARPPFFDRVYLFPYLHIPHREETQVIRDAQAACRDVLPFPLRSFSHIYVAGGHFYFSLCLIQEQIPFCFFEDAAGMLSRAEELYRSLSRTFPLHAEIARRHGLFDGKNPCISRIYCLKSAQTVDVCGSLYRDFSVEWALQGLPPGQRKRLLHLFLPRRIRARGQAILLTQQFAGLGIMSEDEQRRLYQRLLDGPLRGIKLIIKKHPDDTLDYRRIFPGAQILRGIFPSELLPYIFFKKPDTVYAFDSTGCENLKEHFIVYRLGREIHEH